MARRTIQSHDADIRQYIQDGLTIGEITTELKRSKKTIEDYCSSRGYKPNTTPKTKPCPKVGDKIRCKTVISDNFYTGIVTYIHPQKWWYMAEFVIGDGVVRECYQT